MEGFDIRTLAITNFMLGILLSMSSVFFAKVHASFRGFYQLGMGYFIFALGYILLALRLYINDFASIILANLFIATGLTIVIVGILKHLHYPKEKFIQNSSFMLIILCVLFFYFTFVEVDINARIITISTFISGQAFYSAYKTYGRKSTESQVFIRLLSSSCLLCALAFLWRIYITINAKPLESFMNAGYVDAISLMALQLFIVITCLSLS